MCAMKRMSETDWLEVPIFIHGVSPEENPTSHKVEYGTLLKAINYGLKERSKPALKNPIYVEWGRKYPGSKGTDQYLAQVERRLNTFVKESMGQGNYASIPVAYKTIRELLFFAVTDLMYYVSSDGEKALRAHVFRDRKSTRLNSSHIQKSRMPSSA